MVTNEESLEENCKDKGSKILHVESFSDLAKEAWLDSFVSNVKLGATDGCRLYFLTIYNNEKKKTDKILL